MDEPALIEALARGVIAGAALRRVRDGAALPREPAVAEPTYWYRRTAPAITRRWAEDVVAPFVENLRRFRAGEPLRSIVDVELGYAPGGRS